MLIIGFGPPMDFNLGSSAWGAYRALGQTNIPMNWGSLAGVNVNPLLHPSVWDSLNTHRSNGSIAPAGKNNYQNFLLLWFFFWKNHNRSPDGRVSLNKTKLMECHQSSVVYRLKILSGNLTGAHGEPAHVNNGLRSEVLNRRSDSTESKNASGTEDIQRNGCASSSTTGMVPGLPSAAPGVPSTIVSTLPHHNAQFLLANPWLHTSLLYSQLYNQRIQAPSTQSTQSALSVDPDSDQADQADQNSAPCKFPSRSPPTTPKSSVSSPASSSTKETREKEVDGKRSEVWRPYWNENQSDETGFLKEPEKMWRSCTVNDTWSTL